MDVRGEATLTAEDIADAQFALPSVRGSYRIVAAIVFFAAFFGLQALDVPVGTAAISAAGFAYAAYALRAGLERRVAMRDLASRSPDELHLRYHFDDAGYRCETADQRAESPWETLRGWYEGRDTIAFQASERTVHVVPKRAMTADDLERLRSMLRQRVRGRTSTPSIGPRFFRKLLLWAVLILLFLSFYLIFARPR